ncbi:MAG: HDOD domain-containing protein [Gemmatimonadales bacterium]
MTTFPTRLEGLFTSGKQLPTLPSLVLEVQRALANEMSGLRDIGSIIERDPALTARVLRVANSVAFSRGDPVTTVRAAIGRLGLANVRALCLTVGVVRAFGRDANGLDHARYWEHSAAVGLVAERLSGLSRRYASVDGGEAYTSGLLHDVGLLIEDQFFSADFAEVQAVTESDMVSRHQVERDVLGMDHGAIGGRMLERWGLPPVVQASVSCHHRPDDASSDSTALAMIVWGAEALCTAAGLELTQEGSSDVAPGDVFDRLDLDPECRETFLTEVGAIGDRARRFTN